MRREDVTTHSGCVLIVEDDRDTRESLAALLEAEGYRVLEAEHGAVALDVLRRSPVCIILLDIFMPIMNGHAFIQEQRRDPALAGIPVVVMTADAAAAGDAARRGVAEAMTKPLDHDRLLEVVAHHC
jgi:CheY-like chemotaxis protein